MQLRPWLFLSAAVVSEVVGVTIMKIASDSGSIAALLFMYAMIGLSFWFLATTVKHLPIATAYAAWEAAGLISITCIGFALFGEHLDLIKLLGMLMLIIGVILVAFGSPGNEAGKPDAREV
jgi:spermidine export protein MdtJ